VQILFFARPPKLDDNLEFYVLKRVNHAVNYRGLSIREQEDFKTPPDAMHALTPSAQGTRLFDRLKDHWNRSFKKVQNLNPADFDCRYLVVKSAWVETAEDFLIEWFHPVWNDETNVCYGFGKHGDAPKTRQNERSPWDTLHPGRPWATSKENRPNKKSIAEIRADIAEHFKKHPPSK